MFSVSINMLISAATD